MGGLGAFGGYTVSAFKSMKSLDVIRYEIRASIALKQFLLADDDLPQQVSALAHACVMALKVFLGELFLQAMLADVQHLSAEFTSRFMFDRV